MKGLLAAALAETVLISYRDVKQNHILPLPSNYVSVAVVYGALGLLPDSASNVSAAVGWGLVLATFLNLWKPAGNQINPSAVATPGIGNPPFNPIPGSNTLSNNGTGPEAVPTTATFTRGQGA
jgi:hypothetical protein